MNPRQRLLSSLALSSLALSSACFVSSEPTQQTPPPFEAHPVAVWGIESVGANANNLLATSQLPLVHEQGHDWLDLGRRVIELTPDGFDSSPAFEKPVGSRLVAIYRDQLLLQDHRGVWAISTAPHVRSERQQPTLLVTFESTRPPVRLGDHLVFVEDGRVTVAALSGSEPLRQIPIDGQRLGPNPPAVNLDRSEALWSAERGNHGVIVHIGGALQTAAVLYEDPDPSHRILDATWAKDAAIFTVSIDAPGGAGKIALMRKRANEEVEQLHEITRAYPDLSLAGDGEQAWLQVRGDGVWWASKAGFARLETRANMQWLTGQPGMLAWLVASDDDMRLYFAGQGDPALTVNELYPWWFESTTSDPRSPTLDLLSNTAATLNDDEDIWGDAPSPPAVTLKLAKAKVQGDIDANVVRRVIRAHSNELRSCYAHLGELEGDVEGAQTLLLRIGADGRVEMASVQENANPRANEKHWVKAGKCVSLEAAKRWRFPKPKNGEPVHVEQPILLSPAEPR